MSEKYDVAVIGSGASGATGGCPQLSCVRFDNRTADGKSHALGELTASIACAGQT
jgi:hypothetical protein